MRYCPSCATRLKTTSSRGGIPRRECPECADDRDDARHYGGNRQLVADGGRPGVGVGDRVKDLDSEEDDELLVVRERDEPATEIYVRGRSVAEYNPEYPPNSRVVDCVYTSAIDTALEGWRSVEDVRDAVAFDALTAYSFPAGRLRRVGEDDEETGAEAFL